MIAIMGILIAIAVLWWLSLLEARRVEAAARQLEADLRLAHARATNQLVEWRVVLVPERAGEEEGPDYYLVKLDRTYSAGGDAVTAGNVTESIPRYFPANVKVRDHDPLNNDDQNQGWWVSPAPEDIPETGGAPTRTLGFKPYGAMTFYMSPSASICVTVRGSPHPERRMTVSSATSRVSMKDGDCGETRGGDIAGGAG